MGWILRVGLDPQGWVGASELGCSLRVGLDQGWVGSPGLSWVLRVELGPQGWDGASELGWILRVGLDT